MIEVEEKELHDLSKNSHLRNHLAIEARVNPPLGALVKDQLYTTLETLLQQNTKTRYFRDLAYK